MKTDRTKGKRDLFKRLTKYQIKSVMASIPLGSKEKNWTSLMLMLLEIGRLRKPKKMKKTNCDSGTNTYLQLKASSNSSLWRQAHYRNWKQNTVVTFESSGSTGKWSNRKSTHLVWGGYSLRAPIITKITYQTRALRPLVIQVKIRKKFKSQLRLVKEF